MLGALAGDIIGSVYEARPIKETSFPLFAPGCRYTDDTVMTVAIAHALLTDGDYAAAAKQFGRRHPDAGYGGFFVRWLASDSRGPYHSWGNGAAMRVSPVGWAFDSAESVLAAAAETAAITHDHPEGIKGAQAVALAVFRARQGTPRARLRAEIGSRFGYDMDRTVADIRPTYSFDVSCQGSVPESLIAYLEAGNAEEAIRLAISLGGDADTMACIAGAVAEAEQGLPATLVSEVRRRLPADLLAVTDAFCDRFGRPGGN